jgi:hypothetical protein
MLAGARRHLSTSSESGRECLVSDSLRSPQTERHDRAIEARISVRKRRGHISETVNLPLIDMSRSEYCECLL